MTRNECCHSAGTIYKLRDTAITLGDVLIDGYKEELVGVD